MPSVTIVPPRIERQLPRPLPPTTVSPLRLALFPARIFLALGWTRAGIEKLIDGTWWTGDYLLNFLDAQQATALPFATFFTDMIGSRMAILVSFIVLVLELVLGFCLLTGRRLATALVGASALNIAFVALGAVNPSAFYLVIQLALIMGLVATRPLGPLRQNLTVIGGCLFGALAMTPFISTLHPHGVIDDPAIMLATLAILVAATVAIRMVDHYNTQQAHPAGAEQLSLAAKNLRAWARWRS